MDYRGFGYSSGSPTEKGLITDAAALIQWAIETAGVPPERIVLVGQSLGTAVTTAVAEKFALESAVEFAGIVLVAPFTDIPSLLLTYSFGGFFPVLSPLRPYPSLQQFFQNNVQDTWNTEARVANLVRNSQRVKLYLIHSKTDFHIPWSHSEALFFAAANATSPKGLSRKQVDGVKHRQDLSAGGSIDKWNAGGTKLIMKQIVRYGG